jgi:hypothetical protein
MIKLLNKDIVITELQHQKCREFAEQSAATHFQHYEKRGQSDHNRIVEQILVGKLGEVAVYKFLSQYKDCSKPDFNIYPSGKTFDSDIKWRHYRVHVKTQDKESAELFGLSWTFQKSNATGNDSRGHNDHGVFKNYDKDDLIFFCNIKNDRLVRICASVDAKTLHEKHLFALPVKQSLQESKRCVYYNMLEESLNEKQ